MAEIQKEQKMLRTMLTKLASKGATNKDNSIMETFVFPYTTLPALREMDLMLADKAKRQSLVSKLLDFFL